MTDFLIDMHNTTVYRGNAKILDRFSLKIPLQESVAILGPNGAGKTTLLKVLMRELYPVRSEDAWVRILGRESWNVWELRRNLGFISQDLQNRYFGYVKGRDIVMSGFYSSVGTYEHQEFKPEWIEQAQRIMKELGIDDLKDGEYSRMSTGEQRRFLLARALVSDPNTLVLDEPTSGLDLNAMFNYLKTIRKLIKGGKQLVLVTHHIHEIPPEVTTVVLLKDGRLEESGVKQDMLTDGRLSELYEASVKVVTENGFYQVLPGK